MRIHFDNPDEPVGVIFDYGGLALPNATTIVISKELEDMFLKRNGRTLAEAIRASEHIKVEEKKSEVK